MRNSEKFVDISGLHFRKIFEVSARPKHSTQDLFKIHLVRFLKKLVLIIKSFKTLYNIVEMTFVSVNLEDFL